jgi:putative ABC transport system ATP-binding protein
MWRRCRPPAGCRISVDIPQDRLRVAGLRRERLGPLDIAVGTGKCLAISGRSGVGKSLLLRMIADLDPHDGEAWLDGFARSRLTGPQWRRQVMYCAADSGWWHDGVGSHFSPAPPLALAARLGLASGIFTQAVRLCSTGERQRLSLLRALVWEPPVLLLDEPTGPLDPESTGMVEEVLRARLDGGTSIIMVTHDRAQADRLADQRLVMLDGRLIPA